VRVITLNDETALIDCATPFKAKISNAERGRSFPPPHVVGYGLSSAVATWKPAR